MNQYRNVKYDLNLTRPYMVSWDVTNKCNMRCQHCFNNSGDSSFHNFIDELSEEEMIRTAYQISNLKPVQCCLCGGEPLLNESIYKIISILSQNNIMVNMVSNGLLLTEEVAIKLKRSGISRIQISVDGLGYQHDIFRNMPGAFEKAIKALQVLIDNDIDYMISFCPNKINYKTFPLYVSYLNALNCKSIRMMPLLPLGRGRLNFDHLLLDSNETFIFIQMIHEMRKKYSNIEIEWGDPLEHLHLVLHNKRKHPFVMCIASNGDLSITPYIPIVVGNVKYKTLEEYWNGGYNKIWGNKEVLSIIKNVKTIIDLSHFKSDKIEIML